MKIYITETELTTLIKAMLLGGDTSLYQKLCNYRTNHLIKTEETKE
jgi:hypothetical protein